MYVLFIQGKDFVRGLCFYVFLLKGEDFLVINEKLELFGFKVIKEFSIIIVVKLCFFIKMVFIVLEDCEDKKFIEVIK